MKKKLFIKCSIAVAACLLLGFAASVAANTSGDEWFSKLEKPFFNPPTWLFATIWMILFLAMGIAAGIVWSKGFYHKWVKVALYHFGFQLILTGFWFILFFGFHKPFLALLISMALLVLLLLTIKWFRIISDTAAALMIPHALWVLFLVAFTFEIWRINVL